MSGCDKRLGELKVGMLDANVLNPNRPGVGGGGDSTTFSEFA